MDTQVSPTPQQGVQKTYITLPPEIIEPAPFLSGKFVAFSVLVIAGAALAGLVESGKISLSQFGIGQKAGGSNHFVSVGVNGPVGASATATAAAPAVPPPAAGTFVVTSISIGQPSFAIINGASRMVGDSVDVPGASGWKVKQIDDETVWIRNGSTVTSLPLSTPGIKPLDDSLKPLN